jgi:hypothetical protein
LLPGLGPLHDPVGDGLEFFGSHRGVSLPHRRAASAAAPVPAQAVLQEPSG